MSSAPGSFQALTWKTKLAVKLSLAEQDIVSPSPVRPVLVLAPRNGFLPSLIPHFLTHVQHVLPFVPGQTSFKPWFDCRGLPLKWQLPTGVLFDLLAGDTDLPWELTVHLSTYPEELLPWDSPKALQDVFFNSLKESSYICRRAEGSNAVMRLSTPSRQGLWRAVDGGQQQAFESFFSELGLRPEQQQASDTGTWWPSIPVRVVWRSAGGGGWLGTWEQCFTTTRPFPATHASAAPAPAPSTLLHLLQAIKPPGTLQSDPSGSVAAQAGGSGTAEPAGPGTPAQAEAADSTPPPLTASSGSECDTTHPASTGAAPPAAPHAAPTPAQPAAARSAAQQSPAAAAASPAAGAACGSGRGDGSLEGVRVVVGGVEPPLDTPLAWLHQQLHAPDYFLYVVVHSAGGQQ